MGRLFWKFFFSFWLTLILATVSVGSIIWLKRSALDEVTEPSIRFIDHRAKPFVDVAANIAEFNGTPALRTFLQQLEQSPMPSIYAVNDDDQDLLNRTIDVEALEQAKKWHLISKRKTIQKIKTDDGYLLLFALLPKVEMRADGKRRPPKPAERPFVLLIISGLLASLIFSALLAWYFSRPIRTLKQAFQDVAKGKLDTRVSDKMSNRYDEIGELGHHFDFMTSQVATLLNSQRQLLHDVSHELRSPLARMQAAIGIAEQQPEKVDSILKRLDRETNRMSDLVGELLLLSRLESGTNYTQRCTTDISVLLDEIITDAEFEANSKRIHIDYQRDEILLVNGHQELLHRAIENVVRNAIKYSHTDSTVCIHAQQDINLNRIRIRVTDQGPGVAEADLDKLFNPFFRSASPLQQEGIGLGLTIAQRAVLAHKGEIEAENLPSGGLSLIISIPLAQ